MKLGKILVKIVLTQNARIPIGLQQLVASLVGTGVSSPLQGWSWIYTLYISFINSPFLGHMLQLTVWCRDRKHCKNTNLTSGDDNEKYKDIQKDKYTYKDKNTDKYKCFN